MQYHYKNSYNNIKTYFKYTTYYIIFVCVINKNNNTILLEIVIDNKVVETKHIYNGIR